MISLIPRTEALKQDYFRVKKQAKEQQIALNDVDKGALILEKEQLAEQVSALSAELDTLSAKHIDYMHLSKLSEEDFNIQYQETLKQTMKMKNEYLNQLHSLAYYAGPRPATGTGDAMAR